MGVYIFCVYLPYAFFIWRRGLFADDNGRLYETGSMIVGIGSASIAIIYQFEKPSEAVKRLIHFGVGMGVFYPTALYLGWIPFYPDKILHTISSFFISCSIFMAIWFCFYLFNRGEARKINNRLRELEKDYKKKP